MKALHRTHYSLSDGEPHNPQIMTHTFTPEQSQHQPQHLEEWAQSAIDRDIIDLNFQSIGQVSAFNFLIPNPDRRNDGRLTNRHLETYNRLVDGGWICTGIDPLTMNLSQWGCLKPNQPRRDEFKRKAIKYEHPHGFPTELFCLRVTYRIGLKIARLQGLGDEYLKRMGDVDPSTEDWDFWEWVKATSALNITITEGAKKAASLLSVGQLAIALPGVYNGRRIKKDGVDCVPFLIPQLEVFASGGRQIIFCFDHDDKPKTIANVATAIRKTGKLLERKGCKVSVIGWSVPYKGVDDLIHNLGADAYHEIFKRRQSLGKWNLSKAFGISKLPQTKVNTRYLDPLIKPDKLEGKLIAIKSAKGSGKTEYLATIIAPYLAKGQSVLVITHRIQLAKALAKRLGINHLSEVRSSDTGSLLGYALCADSLHPKSQAKFNPEDWEESIVILDECEQVLWHAFNSPTCQNNRVAILQTFEKLMQTVAESNGTVILSDADLSKVSIDYIQKLTDNRLKLWLLNNSHNPVAGKRKLFSYDSPSSLLEAVCNAIANGERVIIHCSAQKAKSKNSTQNLETFFKAKFPHKTFFRADAETVSDPTHLAHNCIENINEIVLNFDVTLASPTLETGISIDVNHFDSVWCLSSGVQTVDAVCQTIERVRSDVDRHICITTTGMTKIGNGSDNPCALGMSQNKVAKANLSALSLAGFTEDSKDYQSHIKAWSNYAAKVNSGFKDYKANITAKLQSDGYELIIVGENDNPLPAQQIKEGIEAAKEFNYTAEREQKIAAPNPSDLELKALEKKNSKTKPERHREAKGRLTRRYLTEDITDELIIQDDNGWYPKILLHYYLSVGREHLPNRDKLKLQALSPEGYQPFTPDVNKVLLSVKVKALEAVNVSQFFGEDRTFTNDSLADWFEKLKSCSFDIKNFLGVGIGEKSTPITTAQRLLGLLGLKLTSLDQIRINGERTRRYSGVNLDADDRAAVMARWLERDDRAATMAECHTSSVRSNNPTGVTDIPTQEDEGVAA